MGHDTVADLQHHVERAIRGVRPRQPGQHARDLDATLQPSADFQEAPAGEAIHVLVQQAGEARELAQQDSHRPRGIIARRNDSGEAMHGLGQVLQRQPAVGREAVAYLAGAVDRAVQRADQGRRYRHPDIDTEGFEMIPYVDEQRHLGIGRLGQPRVIGAQHPHCVLGPFDVAAEPCQVLGGAAGQAARHGTVEGVLFAGQQRLAFHRPVADHPHIGRLAAALHGKSRRVERETDAGEAARHHRPAIGRARQVDAQARRARFEPAVDKNRRRGKRHRLLADESRAVLLDARR